MKIGTKRLVVIIVSVVVLAAAPLKPIEITPRVELIVHGCDQLARPGVAVTLKSASPYEFMGHYEDRISDSNGRVTFERRVVYVSIARLIIVRLIDALSIINPHVDTRIRSAAFFKDTGSGYVSFMDGENAPDHINYCSAL